jgi:hypothetical protein
VDDEVEGLPRELGIPRAVHPGPQLDGTQVGAADGRFVLPDAGTDLVVELDL